MTTYNAAFRVMGKNVDPDEISLLLGRVPDEAHRRGDPNFGKEGRRYSDFSEGLWLLRSSVPREMPLEEHLKDLVAKLVDGADKLKELQRQGFRMDIFIGAFDLGANSGFDLSAEVLEAVGKLGIGLGFDLYSC